jgi:RNA ligase
VNRLGISIKEKLDGSLGIAYYYQDEWHIATKGSFDSAQAIWGTEQLRSLNLAYLKSGITYLFEMIYPDNQIVIKYPFEGLNLLAAYDVDGDELNYNQLIQLAEKLEINVVQKLDANSIKNILEKASNLHRDSEGFVLRFPNGFRLKIKGSEYCRIHKLISGVTPLGIWESLKNGDDLELIRQEIPEEYWSDFDQIHQLLLEQFNDLVSKVEIYHQQYLNFSDKELGLIFNTLPDLARKFIYSRRKDSKHWQHSPKIKEKLYSLIRPTENYLAGYSESQQLRLVKLEN